MKKINIYRKLFHSKEYIRLKNVNLPKFRTNQKLSNNTDYINSGIELVDFLIENSLLNDQTSIFDFGGGQGRLANSLIYSKTMIKSYIGIDTDLKSINWDKKYINKTKYKFIHLPAFNKRYNKEANGLKRFPVEEKQFDLIFLNSVFFHMLQKDIGFYLKEFFLTLKDSGSVYLTAFVEENVPNVQENSENYIAQNSGELHRVRYNKEFFFNLVEKSNFTITSFIHKGFNRTQQSVLILSKRK